MNILQIGLNNLRRRKIKMAFLMVGLMVGVATVVAVLSIVQAMRLDLGNRIDEFGANALILPGSQGVELHYGGDLVSDIAINVGQLTLDDVPKIYASKVAEYINVVSPKLIGAVHVGDQRALMVGIETKQEFSQKPWLALAEHEGQTGDRRASLALLDVPKEGLIMGASAARALGAGVGDFVDINGDDSFYVFGILEETGAEEDGLLFANLAVVQAILGRPGELSLIEVSAYCNACPIEEIVMGLGESLPDSRVMALRQAALFREETIDRFSSFGFTLSGMVVFIAALTVLTTMLSSVNERTREIGILRAIGFRRGHILQIIFLEAGLVSIVAGFLGFLIGSGAALAAGPFLAQIQGSILLRFELLLPAMLLSLILTLVASIYPALKAARLDPAEALRFI